MKTAFLVALLTGLVGATQAPASRPTFNVELSVVASEDIKPIATSYLSRELRSLPDVTVVRDDARYELQVIVLGRDGDCAVSFLLLVKKNAAEYKYLMGLLSTPQVGGAPPPEATGKGEWRPISELYFDLLIKQYRYVAQYWLQVGPDLQKMCKEAVAKIDGQTFERARGPRGQTP